jgi:glycosyltransferase involved in cell wall biosynthesis
LAEVVFPGAIYDKSVEQAFRFHALFYVHGHRVGGPNPSLVEALGAGNAVLAHDNPYNRWVAGEAGVYFRDEGECAERIEGLLGEPPGGVGATPLVRGAEARPSAIDGEGVFEGALLGLLRAAARARHAEAFTWERVLGEYERLLAGWV